MLLHHFYDTGFYCIYCILYIIQVFIVYIVLHTVNRSGIDLNKDDYYVLVILIPLLNITRYTIDMAPMKGMVMQNLLLDR